MVEDGDVNVYKYETCMFEEAFRSFETKSLFIGKPWLSKLTEESGVKGDV